MSKNSLIAFVDPKTDRVVRIQLDKKGFSPWYEYLDTIDLVSPARAWMEFFTEHRKDPNTEHLKLGYELGLSEVNELSSNMDDIRRVPLSYPVDRPKEKITFVYLRDRLTTIGVGTSTFPVEDGKVMREYGQWLGNLLKSQDLIFNHRWQEAKLAWDMKYCDNEERNYR